MMITYRMLVFSIAQKLYERARSALQPVVARLEPVKAEIIADFVECRDRDESLSTLCYYNLFGKVLELGKEIGASIAANRPVIVDASLAYLEEYFQCRIE